MVFSFGEGVMILLPSWYKVVIYNATCKAYPAYATTFGDPAKTCSPIDRLESGTILGEKSVMWGCGIVGWLTCLPFLLQQLPVDTQAIQSMASLRAASSTSTTWSSSFATQDT